MAWHCDKPWTAIGEGTAWVTVDGTVLKESFKLFEAWHHEGSQIKIQAFWYTPLSPGDKATQVSEFKATLGQSNSMRSYWWSLIALEDPSVLEMSAPGDGEEEQ